MNNKGFMMAEVVVVASIVLVTMAGLYVSYNKIFSLYNQRIDYYDVPTLYELGNYKKENEIHVDRFDEEEISTSGGKNIFLIKKSNLKANSYIMIYPDSWPKLYDYVRFLSTSLDFDDDQYKSVKGFLVMEKCSAVDDCKYAYLEVYDYEVVSE